MQRWFVYYLLDPVTADILYVGRSHNPGNRKTEFERLKGRLTKMGVMQRHSSFEAACAAELQAIDAHRPPFNKYRHSSPGSLHKVASAETKQKQAEFWRGRSRGPLTPETKAKLSKLRKGRIVSEETRRKLSLATKAQWQDPTKQPRRI